MTKQSTRKKYTYITIYIDEESLSEIESFANDNRYSRSSAIVYLSMQGLEDQKGE